MRTLFPQPARVDEIFKVLQSEGGLTKRELLKKLEEEEKKGNKVLGDAFKDMRNAAIVELYKAANRVDNPELRRVMLASIKLDERTLVKLGIDPEE